MKKKMLKPRKKFIIGILLSLLMCGGIFLPVFVYGLVDSGMLIMQDDSTDQMGRSESQLEGIMDTLSTLEWTLGEVYDNFYSQAQIKADLAAFTLRRRVEREGDESISMVGDGGIVKIENGTVQIPQGFRTGIRKYADQIIDEKGRLRYDTNSMHGKRKDILVYSKISGPYYYVEIINGDELLAYVNNNSNFMEILEGIETAYKLNVYLICLDLENSRFFFNQPGNLVYSTDVYIDAMVNISNRTSINAEDEGFPADREALLAMDGTVNTDQESGIRYLTVVREVEGLNSILVLRTDTEQIIQGVDEQIVSGLVVILVLAIVFIVWVTSVFDEMGSGIMTEEKKNKYSPARIRLIAFSYGILTTLLVFAFSVYMRSLSSIYQEIEESSAILEVLDFRLERVDSDEQNLSKARKNLYMEYGARAAHMIDKYPELNNKEDLAIINSIIGSRFLILFDNEGKEINSSGDYIHMELGDDKVEKPTSTADFRKILHGVPGIAHDTVKDEVIGEELDMVGVRTMDRESGQYGALLLAFDPVDKERQKNNAINSIMQSLIPAGEFCFIASQSDKKITYATINDYIQPNMTIAQAGLKDSILSGNVTDFIKLSGVRHFCVSGMDEEERVIRYVVTPNGNLFGNSLKSGMLYAGGYAVLFLVLSVYLLAGYTNKKIQELEAAPLESKRDEGGDETERTNVEKGKNKKDKKDKGGPRKQWERMKATIAHWLEARSPERKAILVLQIFLLIGIVNMLGRMTDSQGWQRQNALFTFILQGKWNKGFNLFALTAIILLGISLFLGLMFVRFIMATIGRMLNPRGQTICKLISNMFNYLGVLVFLYYALSYIGVDTNAILASVGVLGIGLSMGARDLIADIFAGVSTIFEGEYQVGDIVNINGYRGTVEEIGVRSTRVVGRGGNERIFSNKDIVSVINLTKMNSWVAITIRVDVNYPLQEVEGILAQKLPEIGANCKYIINGPIYKGVLSVEGGFAVLSIIAECNEDNYHKVERILNREVLLALRSKDVPVK